MSLTASAGGVADSRVFSADRLPRHSHAQRMVRRGVDLVVGVTGLAIAVVPGLVIAAAVKGTSAGPALFVHERVGSRGETIRVVKFRTMRDGTHETLLADPGQWAAYRANDFKLRPDDPRITPLGRWLRRTSLDELPQLLNVVRGEMSLVGIRPLLPEELALRSSYDRALYQMMRPGMTGLWQVEGRSSVRRTDRVALDRRYVEQWTLLGDLRIMARTVRAVRRMDHAR